jgi:ribosomal-protein-alanine N-acetyltransferase
VSCAELAGERVLLRPIAREVAAELLADREPAHVAFAPGYPSKFSLEVMDLLAGARAAEDARGFNPYFVMCRADADGDGAVVGEIGFSLDERSGTATLGYSIVEPSWGHGYATEALRTLVAHLRTDPRVTLITAQTPVSHGASRRVMEKAGMRLAGERLGEVDGELVELAIYELR